MITPIFMPSGGGGLSYNILKAILIVANAFLLILFAILYYGFIKSDYVGSFWEYSWSSELYFYEKYSYSFWPPLFWIPFLMVNGIALLSWCIVKVTIILDKYDKENE